MRYKRQLHKTPEPMNVIFIGDSYGAGYGLADSSRNWIDYTAGLVQRSPSVSGFSYKKSAVNGSGFIGGSTTTTFLKQLQGLTTEGSEQNLNVTDIVVCAGYNDQNKDDSAIKTAFQEFREYCKEQYPFATVHVGFIGWQCCEKKGSLSKVEINTALEQYIRHARENGMAYIGNIHYIMHDYSLFQSDGIHPTDVGGYRIASAVCTHLLGGQVEAIDSYKLFSPEWNTNISDHGTGTGYFTWRHNGRSGIWLDNTSWKFTNAVNFSGHPADDSNGVGWYTLFSFSGQLLEGNNTNQAVKFNVPCIYSDANGMVAEMDTWFWFAIENNKTVLKISPYGVDNGWYKSLSGIKGVMANIGHLDFSFDSLYC